MFKTLIVIILSSVFVDNYVLSRFLGICPFLGVSKKLDQATGMGIAVTAVMLLACAVTWPIQYFVLNALNMGYLQNIVFILVIAAWCRWWNCCSRSSPHPCIWAWACTCL